MFAALAGELAGPAAGALTACELEELIGEESRKAVLQLLQDHYDLRALREEQQARKHPAPGARTRGAGRGRRRAGRGPRLRAAVAAPGRPGGGGAPPPPPPADPALSLPAGRPPPPLANLAALEAARSSFESAHDAIARRCGPV